MRRAGFSLLLEVLLGLSLFALAVLFLLRLFPASDASVGQADRVAQATQMARRLMEERLGQQYDQLNVGTVSGKEVVQHASRRGSAISTEYAYQVDVAQVQPSLKRIQVKIDWQTGPLRRQVLVESSKGRLW